MSDKKEIATLSIKISVDSTDLGKLEAQLKRIAGLMVNAGLKEPTSVGFSADMFFVKNGQTFIDSAFITSGTVSPAIKYTISGLHSDEYKEDLKQAVKQAIRPVIRQHIKVERVKEKQPENVFRGGAPVEPEGCITVAELNDKCIEQAELVLKSSAEIVRLSETISHEDSEFEALKESVAALMAEKEQERALIASIQHTIADSNHAQAEAIRQLAIDMQRSRSGFC